MKKFVLLAVLLCTAINASFALEFYDNDNILMYRTLEEYRTVEVVGWSGEHDRTGIDVPSEVVFEETHYVVKAIGEGAFSFIADPWRDKSLEKITLPETIESIGARAFYNCNALKSLVIPQAVKSIGTEAFCGCPLSSIIIPDNVESIGHDAFKDCTSLRHVRLGSKITILDIGLFYNCEPLESVNIPAGVTEIRSRAFYNCAKLKSITLPKKLSIIGSYAFEGCTSLTSITIPSSVTEIPNGAFADCNAIRYVKAKAASPCYLANSGFSDVVFQHATLSVPVGSIELYQQSYYWNRFQSIMNMDRVTLDKDVVTFTSGSDLDFSNPIAGLKAYVVSAVSNGKAVLAEVTGTVPAGTGLIIIGAAKATYDIPYATNATGVTNKLVGVTTETAIGGNDLDYILKDGKFVKAETGYISAGKAYLRLDAALARQVIEIDEGATGVDAALTNSEKVNSGYYNLQGQRISQPARGLYIVHSVEGRLQGKNGRKIFIK